MLRTTVSREFKIAIKLAEIPAWRIARKAGVHPNVLSQIMTGAIRIRRWDPRVLKIAKLLSLKPEDCFDDRE